MLKGNPRTKLIVSIIRKQILITCKLCTLCPSMNGTKVIDTVYHSLNSVMQVLKKQEHFLLPEVQELIEIYNSNKRETDENATWNVSKPFIVFEGLDGCGKTTVSKKLANKMDGVCMSTPPTCLLPLRHKFDDKPVELRRAYYSLGNYLAACEIKEITKSQPVFLDRFWHSTAAFTIASEVSNSTEIPIPGDPIYEWPGDLLRPTVVFFLHVSEEKRKERLSRRTVATEEEEQLKKDAAFRNAVTTAYHRMRNPAVTVINSDNYIKQVIKDVTQVLQTYT